MGEKLTAQTENTAPAFGDLVFSVDDPAGTPLDRKVTIQSLVNTMTVTTKTASYLPTTTEDRGSLIRMNVGSANTFTIPANSSVAYPTGTCILVQQMGTGATSIAGNTGVTIQGAGQSVSAGSCTMSSRYGLATCVKLDTDTWLVQGNVGAIA